MAQELVDENLVTWTTPQAGAVRELGYSGAVEVLPGPLATHIANAAEVFSQLPIDSVLKGFRVASGLPAPGRGLSGWAKDTAEPTFGQWVSGLARLSSVLSDPSLAARAVDLVDGYAATLPSSGKTGMAIYGWEKLVCGLVDTFVYAKYEPALKLLSKLVRAASFDQTRPLPVPSDPAGAGTKLTREWYTLPENLYRGFDASGDEALAEFAQLWHYDSYWNRFLHPSGMEASWDVPVWLHAYSHVNTLASAAAAFETSKDPHYLPILRNGHDWLLATQCYATGGYGPAELTVPADGSLGKSLEWRTDTAETICGAWAVFKLCSALLRQTSDLRYLEWPEKLLYNGLLAALPLRPDGLSPYYADYRLGCATKSYYWEQWPCCSGTYIQAFSFVPNLIYHAIDSDGIAVSLYVASRVRLDIGGQPLVIEQQTRFPDEDKSVVHVIQAPATAVTIWIRLPSWADQVDVQLNGSVISDPAQGSGTWLAVRRVWAPGDTLSVLFQIDLKASPVDAFHPNRVALQFGPVVLAQDAASTTPFSVPLPWRMADWKSLLAREGHSLTFCPLADSSPPLTAGKFRPLYDFPERYPHRVYLDLDSPRAI
ncbi:MAG: beta-L-arabinofuranosidase domain-containing protein [Acidimicrobiales bacterium]|jgi:hypothetical protein